MRRTALFSLLAVNVSASVVHASIPKDICHTAITESAQAAELRQEENERVRHQLGTYLEHKHQWQKEQAEHAARAEEEKRARSLSARVSRAGQRAMEILTRPITSTANVISKNLFPTANPKSAVQAPALSPEPRTDRQIDTFVDAKLVLSGIHLEALLRTAVKREVITLKYGDTAAKTGAFTPSKSALKKVHSLLATSGNEGDQYRRIFADSMIDVLAHDLLPESPEADLLKDVTHLQKVKNQFLLYGAPSIAELQTARLTLHWALKAPGGRELLRDVLVNSNTILAGELAKRRMNQFNQTAVRVGSVLPVALAAYFGTGYELYAAPAAVTGAWNYFPSRMSRKVQLFASAQRARVKELVLQNSSNAPAAATPLLTTVEISQPLIRQAFERVHIVAERELVETFAPDLGAEIDFATASAFGEPLLKRVLDAVDLMTLISENAETLSRQIRELEDRIVIEKRAATAGELIEKILATTQNLFMDNIELNHYVTKLKEKLETYVIYGESAKADRKLSSEAGAELDGALYELRGALTLLSRSSHAMPFLSNITAEQRQALRELRLAQAESKIDSSGSIARMKSALQKLKTLGAP